MASELSLFNDIDEELPTESIQSDWQEVPQAVFLSWPERRQLAYCAARDEDSARMAADQMDAAWYLGRAARYRKDAERAADGLV